MSSNLDALRQNAAALSLGAVAPSVSFASPIAAKGAAAFACKEGIVDVDEGTEGRGDSYRVILSFDPWGQSFRLFRCRRDWWRIILHSHEL
jgi:hypothetical protein